MSCHICAGQSERHDRRRYRHEDKRFHKRAGAKKLLNRRDKRGGRSADFNAPSALVSVITQANEAGEFGAPVNEDDKDDIKTVHAAGSGEVTYAGIDRELGMCVKIKHKDKFSVYGNLYTLTVVAGDKVKKGDLIGTFDSKGEEEFYYQLGDSVV